MIANQQRIERLRHEAQRGDYRALREILTEYLRRDARNSILDLLISVFEIEKRQRLWPNWRLASVDYLIWQAQNIYELQKAGRPYWPNATPPCTSRSEKIRFYLLADDPLQAGDSATLVFCWENFTEDTQEVQGVGWLNVEHRFTQDQVIVRLPFSDWSTVGRDPEEYRCFEYGLTPLLSERGGNRASLMDTLFSSTFDVVEALNNQQAISRKSTYFTDDLALNVEVERLLPARDYRRNVPTWTSVI